MRILIRRWVQQAGQRTAADRTIDVKRLRIGRGTDQDIELADLRVALTHAEIVQNERHAMLLAHGRAIMTVNDESVTEHKLRRGDVIDIGRFRLFVAPAPAGTDFQIEVEERISSSDDSNVRRYRKLTLAGTGLSRRMPSWALFIIVLFLGLLLPAGLRFGFSNPAPATVTALRPATGSAFLHADRVWLSGRFSDAHAYFKADCANCHQVPFTRVRDSACQACHRDAHAHVKDKRWLAQPIVAQARCTDCHQEHHGNAGLVRHDDALCSACHAQPQQHFPGSRMTATTSFSKQHPPFTPLVARYQSETETFRWIQVRMDSPTELHSQTNLKFHHSQHLDPHGIPSPSGMRTLHCNDCHVPDASGVSFRPVAMQRDCAGCHRLDFDPGEPQRTVPHGDPRQVISVIRDFYAHQALSGRMREAEASTATGDAPHTNHPAAAVTTAMRAWADQRASQAITEVFTVRSCVVCHTVEPTGNAAVPYRVLPVASPVSQRLTGARIFNHALHRAEPCSSCHVAAKSQATADERLPDIKRCRDCHGDPGSGAMVQSTCVDCHGYHQKGSVGAAAIRPQLSFIKPEAQPP
ncbi:MAG: FHA domain-containing protein [Stenotrophobium sp.]